MASLTKRRWTYKGQQKEGWEVRYKHGGKHRSKTFGKKKDAERFKQEVERELHQGVHTADGETVTMATAAEAWLEDCERRRRIGDEMTGQTIRMYRGHVRNHLIPMLGHVRLNKVSSSMLQDAVNKLSETYKPRTVIGISVTFRMAMNFAVRRKWLRRNPLADEPLRVPKKSKQPVAIPNKEELRTILEALSARRHAQHSHTYPNIVLMVVLALFAGLRRGEISGLQWRDVDFTEDMLRIGHSLSWCDGLKAPKTDAGFRNIPMAAPIRAALLQLRELKGAENCKGHVIQTKHGTPVLPHHLGYFYWRPLMLAAGLADQDGKPKYSLHKLRHAAASMLIESGLEPFHIKGIMGHASIQMTFDTYGHLFPENAERQKAINSASQQFDLGRSSPMLQAPKPAAEPA